MSAGTYNPFAIEKPRIALGEHGEWELGDITDSRHAKIVAWYSEFEKLQESGEESSVADLARTAGMLCEAACINGEGIADLLAGLTDEEVHGPDALGVKALVGVVEFIMKWLAGEESAGNA